MRETKHRWGRPSAVRNASNVLLLLAPTFLMCAIALRQMWLATTDTLSPWKGGGFGMFATVDSPGNRFVQICGWTTAGEEVRVRLTASMPLDINAGLLKRLPAYPTEPDLRSLANSLVGAEFIESTVSELARRDEFFRANPQMVSHFPTLPQHPRRTLELMDRRRQGHYGAASEHLQAVEIVVWRYVFHADARTLRIERMLGPVAADSSTSTPRAPQAAS
ncbi:MAG: hypothetical protein ACF8R7_10080 [Phycisphaerales bacterium JB039]